MPAEPLKFRCYHCNKLLGVSPSKVGTEVACPGCGAELIVPERPAPAPPAPPAEPPEFPDFGPEDIRAEAPEPAPPSAPGRPRKRGSGSAVQPGIVAWDAPRPPTAPEPETVVIRAESVAPVSAAPPPASGGFPVQVEEAESLRADPHRRPRSARPVEAPAVPPPLESAPPAYRPATSEPEPDVAESVARIVEPPSLVERRPVARRDDVVLPRTAVVLWSLLALLAVILAFCTGLFIGHFVWARGIPVDPPAAERPAGPR